MLLKYVLAPFIVLPVLISLTTGSLYQIADLAGKDKNFDWLLDIHKGNFGIINLSAVYPFLNALELLIMALAGITLWFKGLRKKKNNPA